jgi:hypothetical protein
LIVSYIGVYLFGEDHLHILLGMIAAISGKLRLLKYIPLLADGGNCSTTIIIPGQRQLFFLFNHLISRSKIFVFPHFSLATLTVYV